MLRVMNSSRRIPIVVAGVAAALAAIGVPVLANVAWRTFAWQGPGDPDAVASLWVLTAVAGLLALLVAGQLVLLVQRGREVADAVAGGDAEALEAAARRTLAGVRVAAGVGTLVLSAYLAVSAASAARAAGPGFDWPGFALALALLAGPALAALAAPVWFVRLAATTPAGLVAAVRTVNTATLVAVVALGAVLLGPTAGFAGAQAACQPAGSAALCSATNAALGEVVGLIGPVVALPYLTLADRALRALSGRPSKLPNER
jgi:hypothetical protein